MPELCIRVHIEGMDIGKVQEYLKKISECWFVARHNTDRPHYHWYINTTKSAQIVRVQLKKMSSSNRLYSLSELRQELYKYYSYVMLKPESQDLEETQGFLDVATLAREYSREVAIRESRGEKIKAVNWFQEVLDNVTWNTCKTDAENYVQMYKFLVKRKYVNTFTIGKMSQMFYMWKSQYQSDEEQTIDAIQIFNEFIRRW